MCPRPSTVAQKLRWPIILPVSTVKASTGYNVDSTSIHIVFKFSSPLVSPSDQDTDFKGLISYFVTI